MSHAGNFGRESVLGRDPRASDAFASTATEEEREKAERRAREPREPYVRPGINHLAYEVDEADAVRRRLSKAGYRTR